MRVHPAQLPAGMLAYAENCRIRDGVPQTRPGMFIMSWTTADPADGTRKALTEARGIGVFSDPDDVEWVVAMRGGNGKARMYVMNESNMAHSVPQPGLLGGNPTFMQAFGAVMMWRGERLAPLQMKNVDAGFKVITDNIANFLYDETYTAGDAVVFPPMPGMEYDSTQAYEEGDLVLYKISHYRATGPVSSGAGNDPLTNPGGVWQFVEWRPITDYNEGDEIVYQATLFRARNNIAGDAQNLPPSEDPDNWLLITSKLYEVKAGQTPTPGETPTGDESGKWQYTRDLFPFAARAIFIQNRVVAIYDRDLIAVSDVLEPAKFQPITNTRYINQGSADQLVGLWKFNDTTVLCFKEQSVYVLENFYGDLASMRLDTLTQEFGLIAPDCVATVGNDVYFLSERGLVSITQTESNKLQGVVAPLSLDVEPLFKRINKTKVAQSQMAYWDNKLYLATAIDGSATNNVVLVYDFLTKSWQGMDTGNAVSVFKFFKAHLRDEERLFALGYDGFIRLYEDGVYDEINDSTSEEIALTIRTRMYENGTQDFKRWKNAVVNIATWGPEFSINAIYPGVNESRPLLPQTTFSRTCYDRPFNRPPFEVDNINGDHADPWRKDYSVDLAVTVERPDEELSSGAASSDGLIAQVVLSGLVAGKRYLYTQGHPDERLRYGYNLIADYEEFTSTREFTAEEGRPTELTLLYPEGETPGTVKLVQESEGVFIEGDGVELDAFQESQQRLGLPGCDRAVQIEIINTAGRLQLLGTEVTNTAGPRQRGALR